MPDRPTLTLAHSPDPDDAFMWWPITGKVAPDGTPLSPPVLDTGRLTYRALPADIEVLNRRAAEQADLDITAISFRNYCDIKNRYVLTACGSSFGLGYGPKLVCKAEHAGDVASFAASVAAGKARIAIPGKRTTAFLLFGLILQDALGEGQEAAGKDALRRALKHADTFVEMPFDKIIPAIARGEVDAGLVIHEGQLLFEQAGLRMVIDVGQWWHKSTGLPTPLGANAIKRDLETRFGTGTLDEVASTLSRSIMHAMSNRRESLEYTMPFALANSARSGQASGEPPTLDRVDRYVSMYVNEWTLDMRDAGLVAVRTLLKRGFQAGLCADPGEVDLVG
jgi:1,4-dihydroxy-6-naphthoate synthase